MNYAWPLTAMDKEDIDAFEKWYSVSKNQILKKKLAIWGAGIRGTGFSILLKEKNYNNIVFVDSNTEKQGGTIDEFSIISPDEMFSMGKSDYVVLVSVENGNAIEEILIAHGYAPERDYYTVKTEQYDEYVAEFNRKYSNSYLFMGDCEFSTISLKDEKRDNLREKLYQYFGKDSVKVLAMHGIGLRANYNIFSAQINMGSVPKVLFIQVNFDTLTGKQHLLPRSQHTELLEKLEKSQTNPSKEFCDYVELTRERSKNIKMEFFSGANEIGAVTENKARTYLMLNYMYNLDIEIEGIVYLGKIFKLAKEHNVKVVPYIPPVNYQLGDRIIGDEFQEKYENNLKIISDFVAGYGIELLDMSYLLTSDLFAGPFTPSETANNAGRDKVVEEFVKALK